VKLTPNKIQYAKVALINGMGYRSNPNKPFCQQVAAKFVKIIKICIVIENTSTCDLFIVKKSSFPFDKHYNTFPL